MDNSDSRLARLLFSNGPASDRADKMGLYGWLIGDWTMDAVMHAPNGETLERRGEIGFAWVLEGRAIQDVWILPDFFYGTTLRVYDRGSTLGTSSGATRSGNSTVNRLAGRTDRTSSSWASPTAERPGACEPNSSADANPENSTKSKGGFNVRSCLHRRPRSFARQALL